MPGTACNGTGQKINYMNSLQESIAYGNSNPEIAATVNTTAALALEDLDTTEEVPSPTPLPSERISCFKTCKETEPVGEISISDVVEFIRNPKQKTVRIVAEIRRLVALGDKESEDQAREIKKGLAAVTLSGTFERRNKASLVNHSGLITIDFDKLTPDELDAAWTKLTTDPHVIIAFRSPSGAGIKGAVRVPVPESDAGHLSAWLACERYFRETHGLTLDPSGKDVCRLCYFSHDADCFHNESALRLDTSHWQPVPPAPSQRSSEHPPNQASEPPQDCEQSVEYLDNDAGHAARYCDRWETEVAYIPEREYWLTWDGRWKRDNNGGLTRRAIELSREMLISAAEIPCATAADVTRRNIATKAAMRWGDKKVIAPMLDLSRSFLKVQIPSGEVDADLFLVGAQNAVIDLKTGEVREYSRDDYITKTLGTGYEENAQCPRWIQFLEEIFPDEEVRRYVWKAAGYSLTGDMREKCFFFLHGCGDNGKSKFLSALEYVFGNYADQAGKRLTVSNQRGDYPLREVAKIDGKRLVLASETEDRERMNTVVIKTITGGDSMDAAGVYERHYTFKPACKIWFAGNHKPSVPDTGPALWERVRLIPFERTFTEEEMDRDLESKLLAEAPGILKWLVQGCLLWQREGLIPPARVVEAVADYRREEDTLGDFIDECTRQCADATILHADIFRTYQEWTRENGMRFPCTKKGLAKQLREKGWASRNGAQGRLLWIGMTTV